MNSSSSSSTEEDQISSRLTQEPCDTRSPPQISRRVPSYRKRATNQVASNRELTSRGRGVEGEGRLRLRLRRVPGRNVNPAATAATGSVSSFSPLPSTFEKQN